jgi:hypothetical protein
MNQPVVLRIYLTPNGVQKVDAPVSNDQDRTRAFEFLASNASVAIKELDASIRRAAVVKHETL